MAKLMKCPFCGGEPSMCYQEGRYGFFGFVQCDFCGARSRTAKINAPDDFDSVSEFWRQKGFKVVFTLWNRRDGDTVNAEPTD